MASEETEGAGAGVAALTAGPVAGTGFAGASPAAKTSTFTMRPWGPEPLSADRSRPLSAAIRRARGEAKMRIPSDAADAAGAVECSVVGVASSAETAVAAALSPASSAGADDSTASEASSPSSSKTAIRALTLTPSLPSGTMILPIVPSSTASNSMVALSVSISAIISPEETISPSFTSHFASVPSSIVGDRAGIKISIGMSKFLSDTSRVSRRRSLHQ